MADKIIAILPLPKNAYMQIRKSAESLPDSSEWDYTVWVYTQDKPESIYMAHGSNPFDAVQNSEHYIAFMGEVVLPRHDKRLESFLRVMGDMWEDFA